MSRWPPSEARAKLKDAVQSRDIEAILLAIEQGKADLRTLLSKEL